MEAFPFSSDEWSQVQEAARGVVNASLAGDGVLQASLLEEFRDILVVLRAKYGEHPVLLETAADFTEDTSERVALYEAAKKPFHNSVAAPFRVRFPAG